MIKRQWITGKLVVPQAPGQAVQTILFPPAAEGAASTKASALVPRFQGPSLDATISQIKALDSYAESSGKAQSVCVYIYIYIHVVSLEVILLL